MDIKTVTLRIQTKGKDSLHHCIMTEEDIINALREWTVDRFYKKGELVKVEIEEVVLW